MINDAFNYYRQELSKIDVADCQIQLRSSGHSTKWLNLTPDLYCTLIEFLRGFPIKHKRKDYCRSCWNKREAKKKEPT